VDHHLESPSQNDDVCQAKTKSLEDDEARVEWAMPSATPDGDFKEPQDVSARQPQDDCKETPQFQQQHQMI